MAAKDLTAGSIPVWVVRLALPTFASFLLQSLYQLADLYFVGRLGSAAIGGLAISINAFFVTLALGMTLGVGALALISQAYGRGARAEIPVLLQQALWMALVAGGTLWLAAALGARHFVALFTRDAAVLAAGTVYFRISAATLMLQLLAMVMAFSFRAVGDFVTPTVLMAVGVLLNLVLDPLLIFGPGPFPRLEVAGAAWATVASIGAVVAVNGWLVTGRRRNPVLALRRPFVLRWGVMRRMLRIGLPSGAQFALFAFTMFVTYRAVRPFGGDATAAVGVGFRILETGVLPIVSVGTAVSSLVGQNYGARRHDRARAAVTWGMALAFALAALETALLLARPSFWVSLFADAPAVQAIGAQYLGIAALALLFMAPGNPIVSAGMGLGRTGLPLVGQTLRVATFLGSLALLVGTLELGLAGIFWSRVLSMVPETLFLAGVLTWWRGTVLSGPHRAPAGARPAPAEAP